jgi:hypothetical protein
MQGCLNTLKVNQCDPPHQWTEKENSQLCVATYTYNPTYLEDRGRKDCNSR